MKFLPSVIILQLVLLLNQKYKTVFAIVGGFRSSNYPFFVVVRAGTDICGGSILSSNAVITAAHCLFDEDKNRWSQFREVFVLKSNFTSRRWRRDAMWHRCERYVYLDSYRPVSYGGMSPYDVALIKLKRKIDLNRPENDIIEPCPRSVEYPQGLTIGLGLINLHPEIPPRSLMGVRLYKQENCSDFYLKEYGLRVDDEKQMCYGSRNMKKPAGTCKGDSGGPIVHKNMFSADVICLIGINSFGSPSCADSSTPDVFIRVSYFEEWIQNTISQFGTKPLWSESEA